MIFARSMLKRFEAGLNGFTNPFLENLQPCETKDILIGLIIFLIAFALFASLCTEALMNGDAAVYIQQMQDLDFANRSVHIGYYLLGAVVLHILPGPDDYVINLMNCFLGALTVAVLYFIALIICRERLVALVSSLFLLTNFIFLENSVYAEVYVPQLCFLLLALLLWLLNRPIIAGLSFALSLLISTSAVFALPLFFILRPRLRPFLLFCALILVIAVVVISPRCEDYFFGGRGLFTIALHQAFSLGLVLRREAGEVFFNFLLYIPFVVAGLVEIFTLKKLRPLAVALLSLWLVTLFLGEKNWNDFVVQLPTYALLCLVGGLGFHRLLKVSGRRQYIVIMLPSIIAVAILIKVTKTLAQPYHFLPVWFLVAVVSCAVLCMLLTILPGLRRICPKTIITGAVASAIVANTFVTIPKLVMISGIRTEYRNTVMEIGKVASPGYVVVGGWTKCVLLEHYLSQKSSVPSYWIDTQDLAGIGGNKRQIDVFRKLREAVAARRQIWLLGNHVSFFSVLRRNGYEISRFKMTQLKDVYVATAKD